MIKKVFVALALALAVAGSAEGAIARVQTKSANTAATNALTLSLTFDSTPTSGNIIVISVATLSGAMVRMTEQAGIIWTVYQRTGSTVGGSLVIGRITSTPSATVTLTMASITAIAMVGAEYSGTNMRFENQGSAVGTSTSPASGATIGATTNADELWVGNITARVTTSNVFSSPTNSFSIVGQTTTSNGTATNDITTTLLERFVSSTGSPNAGGTLASSQPWMAMVGTFEETPTASGASAAAGIPSIGR